MLTSRLKSCKGSRTSFVLPYTMFLVFGAVSDASLIMFNEDRVLSMSLKDVGKINQVKRVRGKKGQKNGHVSL